MIRNKDLAVDIIIVLETQQKRTLYQGSKNTIFYKIIYSEPYANRILFSAVHFFL